MRDARYDYSISLDEARENNWLIGLFSSQTIRFIDEINGVKNVDFWAKAYKKSIENVKKCENSIKNSKIIKNLYKKLDECTFLQDYVAIIMDKKSDYKRLLKGFYINGVKYTRMIGTNGGVKNSTIIFVSDSLYESLNEKLECGRDVTKAFEPGKFESYKSLAFSASIPVSFPKGILVVNDCETTFKSDVINIQDSDDSDGEPILKFEKDAEVHLNASDGCGMMSPKLAARWSRELGLDYVMAGCTTRYAWEKGVANTFDFHDFAENVAHEEYVVDAWGDKININDVELVLTTSMVKLWESYSSCADYVEKTRAAGFEFAITKTCPKELESERRLNYQFIQSYELSDDDIDELIEPTVREIHDVIHGDWTKAVLFLKGKNLCEDNIDELENDYIKALMIDHRLLNDPYVQAKIYRQIKNIINQAKIGALKVHGNYSVISGDLYALCQSMFGLPVTGLLKSGEIYNFYWDNVGCQEVAGFRAPMTCHNNIRRLSINRSDEVRYWYRYMPTITVLNAWDTTCHAMNGCDFDGDIVLLTDNDVLLRNLRDEPALMCVQRKAEKKVITQDDLIKSNINSFGDEIGKVTNRITSMFDVLSKFEKGSPEYETLMYRIKCGQHYQQATIDKTKGIIAKSMPSTWYTTWGNRQNMTELEKAIVADRKPYFMVFATSTFTW